MRKRFIIFLILTLFSPLKLLFTQDTGILLPKDSKSPGYLKLVVRSAPKVTLEVNGHYNFGVFELSANNNGDFSSSEFVNGENFGVRHGIGVTSLLKLSLSEKGYFRLCFIGSYNRFSSKYSKYLENVHEAGYANYNVFTFGAGVENSFTPGFKFKPLIGFGLLGSVISGNSRVFDKSFNDYRDLTIIPAFRLGLTLYSGVEYLISNKVGLNCGIRIVHANLWLKSSKVSDNPDEIYLNDERVVPRTPYTGWRQFMWGELYGGVNIYFGINQKDYIIKKIQK
jgi:hypothetical protein